MAVRVLLPAPMFPATAMKRWGLDAVMMKRSME
jgi:hypothetical protein